MGNCCRGESSGEDRRALPPKNHRHREHSDSDGEAENNPYSRDQGWRLRAENGASSSATKSSYSSKSGAFREVKIRMTKKELEELVGWLNMADSSFERVMAGLVNVISDQRGNEDDNDGEVVRLRHQRSWRPSLKSIPEIN